MAQQQAEMPLGAALQQKRPDGEVAFTRLSFICTKIVPLKNKRGKWWDARAALFLESTKPERKKLFEPGIKWAPRVDPKETLIRKMYRDLGIRIIPSTLELRFSFRDQAFGMPDDTMMDVLCFTGDFLGDLHPNPEYFSRLRWLYGGDGKMTTSAGGQFLQALSSRSIID
jgi:8-oxo-dGTP diphosphatase